MVNPSDARTIDFIDDLRNHLYEQVDDGAGGERVMTRTEAGEKYLDDLLAAQVKMARALKERRLKAEFGEADDLLGSKL